MVFDQEVITGKKCPYCDAKTVLVDSAEVYSRSYGMIYLCRPCKAWVGVHKNSKKNVALGRVGNSTLREWKKMAHASFDSLWIRKITQGFSKNASRKMAYKWLALRMGLKPSQTHIGWMDVEQCKQVCEICKPYIK
jgi:hypothetical protein